MTSKPDRRICGTCKYWNGARVNISDKSGNPKIQINDEKAKCLCDVSNFFNQMREKSQSCVKYTQI